MINRYTNILMVYLRNPGFVILGGFCLFSLIVSKIFFLMKNNLYTEEIFTILFIMSLWLVFHMGIVIKRQFSTPRASLLPHYRVPHIIVIAGWYLVFITIACLRFHLWQGGLRLPIEVSLSGLHGAYLVCLFIAILTTFMGYLSIGRILIYAYVTILIFSNQAMEFVSLIDCSPHLVYVIAAACIFFAIFFGIRLWNLKEENFEHGSIFSWPPQRFVIGQLNASERVGNIFSPLTAWIPRKKVRAIPRYPRAGHIFSRAGHWNFVEHADLKIAWTLTLLALPFVLLLINRSSVLQNFSRDVYSNFLLLSLSPVLITIGANYKRLAYWGYDLIKPVSKASYIKEWAVALFSDLFLYWFLFSICFAIIPVVLFPSETVMAPKFWAYLVLTANVSFIVLNGLALLSCMAAPATVIINGLILGLIVLFYFFFAQGFSLALMIVHNLICLAVNGVLAVSARKAWNEKEFESK